LGWTRGFWSALRNGGVKGGRAGLNGEEVLAAFFSLRVGRLFGLFFSGSGLIWLRHV
jgi:hypothetical protein